MKPITFPKLMLPDPGSSVAPTLGHPLVDDYLESVHARLRPNSTLAGVYELKVFFTVIDIDPVEVRRRHVLEFICVQRTGSTDATVVPIDQSEGLALSTIRRRLSTIAGFYSNLVALGELDHNDSVRRVQRHTAHRIQPRDRIPEADRDRCAAPGQPLVRTDADGHKS